MIGSRLKKIIGVMLAAVMALGLIPVSALAADGTLGGKGTAEEPYLIEDYADLEAFRVLVCDAENKEVCAELTADISLTGKEWTPIATSSSDISKAYMGTFDGKGHKISGLSISSTKSNQGFFGIINGATIKNLTVSGNITSSNAYVGGIVGKMQSGNIENCLFEGSVTSTKSNSPYAGGIAGGTQNLSHISGCVNKGTISGYAGGILGFGKAEIKNCYNVGEIKGTTRAGGIIGQFKGSEETNKAVSCYSIGKISVSATKNAQSGGISAYIGNLTSCYWTEPTAGVGDGAATSTSSELITSSEGLAAKLGAAYTEDTEGLNGGYPLLLWQKNGGQSVPTPKVPKITISGNAKLYLKNNSQSVQTTLSAEYIDCDDKTPIVWSIKSGNDVIELEPDSTAENNARAVVYAKKGGKAVICAAAGELSDEITILVVPVVTAVEISGEAAVGNTVSAAVYVLDGSEYDYNSYPELSVTWKYLTGEDYSAGNTASYKYISGTSGREYKIPESLEGGMLSFEIWVDGECKTARNKRVVSAAEGKLNEDKAALTLECGTELKSEQTITLPKKGKNGSDIEWTSDNAAVINAETGKVTLPEEENAAVKLTAALTYDGKTASKVFNITVYSRRAVEEERANSLLKLKNEIKPLEGAVLYPEYGTDTNIASMVKARLAEITEEEIAVSVEEIKTVYGGADIAENGDIKYFYADPNSAPNIKFASYKVTLAFELNGAETTLELPVIIYWDEERVKNDLTEQILNQIALDEETPYDSNIELARVIDNKKWALITWTASGENADCITVSIEGQQTADTLFNPYVGIIHRGETDKKVTLTATADFGYSDANHPIRKSKTFTVTLKALDAAASEEIKQGLQQKLDGGFAKAGLKNAVTGAALEEKDGVYTVKNDIKLPTTADFGVDGKYYPITITSSSPEVIVPPDVNNAARVTVIRPPVGSKAERVTIGVYLKDKDTSLYASKQFDVLVEPLTEEEINSERVLMEAAAASYFDGIKGGNTDKDNIGSSLLPFTEAYKNEQGELTWAYTADEKTGRGIIPTAIDGWEELEAWRLFKSSNPSVIAHESLIVSMKQNAKAVTVTSALSSKLYGIYGKLYKSDSEKYSAYADCADLYYREVSAELIVRGYSTLTNSKPTPVYDEKVTASFTLEGPDTVLIEKTDCTIEETATAYDVLKRIFNENGYKTGGSAAYIESITTSDGEKIAAGDYGINSGWLYKVNGKIPDVALSAYGISDGDDIVFFFTKDYNEEFADMGGESSGTLSSVSKNDTAEGTEEKTEQPGEEAPAETPGITVFTDAEEHWASSEIAQICEYGLMKGVSETEFAPEERLTRAMLVTMLYRLEGEPEASGADFADVDGGEWYAAAVAWAAGNGIVKGVSEMEFAPSEPITREQIAILMYRYAKHCGYDVSVGEETNILSYEDFSEISDEGVSAMQWAAGAGILLGRTEATLAPRAEATRAETAVIILRMIKLFNEVETSAAA